jgi:hypothetical protein
MARSEQTLLQLSVEEIVREVLRRLSTQQNVASAKAVEASMSSANGSGELVVQQRVVTLAEVDGQLGSITQLVVPRGAVVTPAVRDLLKHSGVALTFATDGKKPGTANKHRLSVGIAETNYEPAGLLRAIDDQYASIEQLAKAGLRMIMDKLADQVARGGNLGLLLTGQTAVASCLANRKRGVRAAVAAGVADVSAAVAELGTNLLIVDPAKKTIFELVQFAKALAAEGSRQCPRHLQEQLG